MTVQVEQADEVHWAGIDGFSRANVLAAGPGNLSWSFANESLTCSRQTA